MTIDRQICRETHRSNKLWYCRDTHRNNRLWKYRLGERECRCGAVVRQLGSEGARGRREERSS